MNKTKEIRHKKGAASLPHQSNNIYMIVRQHPPLPTVRNRIEFGDDIYIPIKFSFGPVQHLYIMLVWKAPVHTGLLGLACVTRGVIHTHPAHLQSSQVEWETGEMGRESKLFSTELV